jgi:colanic acid biosynthesis glycosyl transferase WcaI
VRDSTGRTVWLASAVQEENTNSTMYLFEVLGEGLSQFWAVGALVPRPKRRPVRNGSALGLSGLLIDRAWRGITRAIEVAVIGLRRVRRGDVIVVVTNPPVAPVVMAWVARVRRSKLIVVVHDVYPDTLHALGLLRPGSLASRLVERLVRGSLRRADRVVVVGRDMARRIEEKLGGDADHVVFIPNWADPGVTPWPSGLPSRGLSPVGGRPLIVQYSGNMGATHAVETLIDSATMLQRADAPVHVQLFGWGFKLEDARAIIRDRDLENVELGGACARSELSHRFAQCDVAVILMRKGMAGISVPCRFYNILAAGKPVIVAADQESEIAMVVRDHQLGWVVAPEDAAALTRAIQDAVRRRHELPCMGQRAAALGGRDYTLTAALERYRALVDQVGGVV